MKWIQNLLNGSERKPAPEAVVTVQKATGNIYVLRIGGVLNKATLDRVQAMAEQDIAKGAKDLRLLILLDDFRGWRKGDDWGNIDFFAQYESYISRIAVVGETGWEPETMLFLAAGHRTGEVRYFPAEQAARLWLAEPR